MKKIFLKIRIIMTNISRIIMSFLFINLSSLFQNNAQATNTNVNEPIIITCYVAGPQNTKENFVDPRKLELIDSMNLEKVFIIAVPVVIVIALISLIIIKKKKSKKEKKDVKKG